MLIFSANPQTFNDFSRPVGTLCLYTFSTLTNTHRVMLHTHTHTTLKQCGSGRVCCHGSLLLQWCSGVTLQPHTAPNVPVLLLAGRSHMGTEQPIWREEHFVWIESLSALRTKEERRRDAVMEKVWWGILVPLPDNKFPSQSNHPVTVWINKRSVV